MGEPGLLLFVSVVDQKKRVGENSFIGEWMGERGWGKRMSE